MMRYTDYEILESSFDEAFTEAYQNGECYDGVMKEFQIKMHPLVVKCCENCRSKEMWCERYEELMDELLYDAKEVYYDLQCKYAGL